MLTIEMLKAMPCGTIFATGKAIDSPEGLFVTNQRQVHHWVAKRGGGASDWALYYVIYTKNWDNEDISKFGAKVIGERNIRFCVPCDDEALEAYRK